MIDQPFKTKEAWIEYFSSVDVPVLSKTAQRLEELRQNIRRINGSDIAAVVLQDPLLAAKVLAYIQRVTHEKYLRSDITTIAHAIMMIGIEPFFTHFESLTTAKALLKNEPKAVHNVLHIVWCAQHASHYAQQWAFERYDMNVEEVGLAALLHDLAEILLWCFAPKLAVEILRYQQTDPTLRSTTAQIQVIGFRLSELQLALCDALHLPELFKTLTGDVLYNETPRVRNVVLAVNLARHSVGSDWNNPALLTDLDAIREFLRVDRRTLLKRLKVPDKMAVKYLSLSRQSPQREEMAVAFDI